MKNSELLELLRYSTPWSIWVVSFENKLIEMKCPFVVLAIRNVGKISIGEMCIVTYLKLSTNLQVVYIVEDTPYFFTHFEILID